VARRDDKPVGFAIVEFADVAVAERTCNKLKSLKIGGRKVELQMCMPGQSVPEAFHQQMSLLVRLDSLHPLNGFDNLISSGLFTTKASSIMVIYSTHL